LKNVFIFGARVGQREKKITGYGVTRILTNRYPTLKLLKKQRGENG